MTIIQSQKAISAFLETQRKELTNAKNVIVEAAELRDIRTSFSQMVDYYDCFPCIIDCEAFEDYGVKLLQDKFSDFEKIYIGWSPFFDWKNIEFRWGLWDVFVRVDNNKVRFNYIGESLEKPEIDENATYKKAKAYEKLRCNDIKFTDFLKTAYPNRCLLSAFVKWQFDKKDGFTWAFEYLDKVNADLFNKKTAHRKTVKKFEDSEEEFKKLYVKIQTLFPNSDFDFDDCIPMAWRSIETGEGVNNE